MRTTMKNNTPARKITARRQCLRIAAADAYTWAWDSVGETFNGLVRALDGESPTEDAYADALRGFDSGFGGLSESPATSAGVPARWAAVYNCEVERIYRREIRCEIARVLAD
jgi:hypothetical protein